MSERDLLTIRAIARPSRSRLNYGYGATADINITDNGHDIFGDSALDDSETIASLTPPSSRDLFDQVLLLNTQNTARDHMSNERTMLSYIRTAISLASAGVAFIEIFDKIILHREQHQLQQPAIRDYSGFIGGALILLGAVLLSIGIYRYYFVQTILQTGRFQPSRRHVYLVNAWLGAVMCMTAAIILAVPR